MSGVALKVAFAGATGNLGPTIVSALLEAGIKVVVLSRSSSAATKLPQHPDQVVEKVDFDSCDSLVSVIRGCDVVISAIASEHIAIQKTLIDATVAAKVPRYILSEFGADVSNPSTAALPFFHDKVAIRAYAVAQSNEHPNFTWSSVVNGAFFDWGIDVDFLLNPTFRSATLYDGGDVPVSVSRLSTISAAVVGIVKHLDITADQAIYVHDAVVTQNQLLNAARSLSNDPTWATETKSTAEMERWAWTEHDKPDDDPTKDKGGVALAFITLSFFKAGFGGNFGDKVWNQRLGLPILSTDEVDKVVVDTVRRNWAAKNGSQE